LNGHPTDRLPNNINISILGVESKALIVGLKQVAIATGSACTTLSVEPSHVIRALGFGEERAHSALRIGVGRANTNAQIGEATRHILTAVSNLHSYHSSV